MDLLKISPNLERSSSLYTNLDITKEYTTENAADSVAVKMPRLTYTMMNTIRRNAHITPLESSGFTPAMASPFFT